VTKDAAQVRTNRGPHEEDAISERVFTSRSAAALMKLTMTDMIEIRKDELLKPHMGKWLRVQGTVMNISLSYDKRPIVSPHYS